MTQLEKNLTGQMETLGTTLADNFDKMQSDAMKSLALANPDYPAFLALDPEAVRRGEVWRLLTYVLMPPAGMEVLTSAIALYFLWRVGEGLEAAWGAFRLTVYYVLGAAATALVAFGLLGTPATPFYLDCSVFLAFATVFPDSVILLFFVIPVRMKWLGWFLAGVLGVRSLGEPLAGKLALVTAFSNYLLFFGHRFFLAAAPAAAAAIAPVVAAVPTRPFHRCTTCGKSERDDQELEFRICACARCGEGREFCLEHLRAHEAERAAP